MMIPKNHDPGKTLKNIRCFAALIRSPLEVRNAFAGTLVLAWWWKGVLALHGKPIQSNLGFQTQIACIADGFRFYGLLYRGLAILIGTAAVVCWFVTIADFYWMALACGSAVYLWVVSGLAFSGASVFAASAGKCTWHLAAFLVFVALFLIGSMTAISVQMRSFGSLPDVMNILLTAGMMVFGVGSYFVELAALVTNAPLEETRSI